MSHNSAQKRNLAAENNPCYKEQNLSLKCLSDNDYDKEKCEEVFDNYKICKGFWNYIVRERRKLDIKPYVPAEDDRERVKELFKTSRKVN